MTKHTYSETANDLDAFNIYNDFKTKQNNIYSFSEKEEEKIFEKIIKGKSIRLHCIAAEKNLIKTILLRYNVFDKIEKLINKYDFYKYDHKLIFTAIKQLRDSKQSITIINIINELYINSVKQFAWINIYLTNLMTNLDYTKTNPSFIFNHVEIMREKSILRGLYRKNKMIKETKS